MANTANVTFSGYAGGTIAVYDAASVLVWSGSMPCVNGFASPPFTATATRSGGSVFDTTATLVLDFANAEATLTLSGGTTYTFDLTGHTTYSTDSEDWLIYTATGLPEQGATPPTTPLTSVTLSTDAPTVGTAVTATVAPSGATVTYQWYTCSEYDFADWPNVTEEEVGENAEAITGATSSSFTPQANNNEGGNLICAATGTGDYSGTMYATTDMVGDAPTPSPTQLSVPGNLTVSNRSRSSITLTFATVANASSYTLERTSEATDGTPVWTNAVSIAEYVSGTAVSGLTEDTTYYFRIKSIGDGTDYSDSAWSNTVSGQTKLSIDSVAITPSNPVVGTPCTCQVTPSDATCTYQWYLGTDSVIDHASTITGATSQTYTPTSDIVGMTLICEVTGTGEYETDYREQYASTDQVTAAPVPLVTSMPFHPIETVSARLNSITITPGQLIICRDTGKLYIDCSTNERKMVVAE